jgi:hypothetical protein
VNLSHVPVYNNYVFLSVDEYDACVKNGKEKYDNVYCYACNKTMHAECTTCPDCNFPVKNANGDFLYYHYVESDTKIQESTRDVLELPTLNIKSKDTAIYRRIQRDRLEMVLSMNSIEHQVKQYGDTTYKFEYVDDATLNKKTYYRRIIRDPLKEEKGGDWYKFMTKPDKEVYKTLCDLYTRQEPDRFKGTIKKLKPVEIIERKSAEPTKSNDGFSVGTEVLYEGEKWFIETKGENDMITINRKEEGTQETKVVNKSELTIDQDPEDSKVEDWRPSSSSDEEPDDIVPRGTRVEDDINKVLNDNSISNLDKYAILEASGVFENTADKEAPSEIPPKIKNIGNTINRGIPVDIARYNIVDVPADGNCMYHAVLQASQCLKKGPGIRMGDNPQRLRNYLVKVLKGECLDAMSQEARAILQTYYDAGIVTGLINRIKSSGIRGWGGDYELKLISGLYNYPITVLMEVNRTHMVMNGVAMRNNGLTLVWVGRNHYRYLKPIAGCLSPSLSAEEYLSDASIQSEY